MGVKISRIDFRRQYLAVYQGLFVFSNAKHMPKNQPEVNLGYELSRRLLEINVQQRIFGLADCLRAIVAAYNAVSITHIEILFTPSLKQDVVGALLALCRNRKVCVCWPGHIGDRMLTYADPSCPEYYETDYAGLVDTYVITE